ncbi:MAG: RdgB/HAM1 family non-canonical purine NTP pyrophosphatase [Cyclobacteriaceae bacterium]
MNVIKLCFATRNKHKLEEVQAMLPQGIQLVGLDDIGCREELAEDFQTLEENSMQKAAYVYRHYHVPCFADDSGLEIDALDGRPGADSAHYAGPQRSHSDNIDKVLRELTGISNRDARFRCVITLAGANRLVSQEHEEYRQFTGVLEGEILPGREGTGGFGYDPIFIPKGFNKGLATLGMDEKNQISHRGRALRMLSNYLLQDA